MGGANFYDPTTSSIITPEGIGKYIRHDAANGLVYIEFDYTFIKVFKSSECYVEKD